MLVIDTVNDTMLTQAGLPSVSADDLSVGVDSIEVRSLDSRSSIYARLKSKARGRFFSGKVPEFALDIQYNPVIARF